jgi:hypothetical protein
VSRKLLQIVFFHAGFIRFAQRFIAGKVLLINATFNINKLRMPLIVSVGITNSEITFPFALKYSGGETAKAYTFYFKTLREEV